MLTKQQRKQQRLEEANKLIKSISNYGRKFFRYDDNVGELTLNRTGRVFYIDGYTSTVIYTHRRYRDWEGFTEGGTLKALIEALRDYITKDEKLCIGWICPKRTDDSNIWGYDRLEAEKLISEVKDFDMFNVTTTGAAN